MSGAVRGTASDARRTFGQEPGTSPFLAFHDPHILYPDRNSITKERPCHDDDR
jgi:hypothetical protein